MKKVSFIVIAYNEEKNITRCLSSILSQKELNNFEIILVDDGSKDNTVSVAKKFARNKKEIKIIDLKVNRGRGYARNTGVKNSTGDYIAFIDADIIISSEWLKTCLKEMNNYDAVGGIAVPDGDVSFIYNCLTLSPKIVPHAISVTGCNCVFKKEIFAKVQYNPNLREGEDMDFISRVTTKKYKLKTINNLLVEHSEHKSFMQSLYWLYRTGFVATRSLKINKKIRNSDLAFIVFIILLIATLLSLFFRSISIYLILLTLAYPLSVSAMHMRLKFHSKKNIINFILAIFLNYPFVISYFIGRIVSLFV